MVEKCSSGAFPTLDAKVCEGLKEEYTEEGIRLASRGMGSYKAPRPDGYQAAFFKSAWNLIRKAVHSFVTSILEGGDIPNEAAEALLVLVPKEAKPGSMRAFRPLGLCNKIQKLYSKMIVNRLKEVWKCLISPYRTSFVPGHQSMDNMIIYRECIHSMRYSKAKKGGVIIKLDLENYDHLECSFIEDTLKDAGIPEGLATVIMKLITTGSPHLLGNGEATDVIRTRRGLRQGIPYYRMCLCCSCKGWANGCPIEQLRERSRL